MTKIILFGIALLSLNYCTSPINVDKEFEVHAHRGGRGLMPENTIPAFLKAAEMGVVIEMDVVITKDYKVLVSHHPWFDGDISLDSQGNSIAADDLSRHNIFRMRYAETQSYDVGMKPHPRFPEQQRIPAKKPLFEDAVKAIENEAAKKGYKTPRYNIDIRFRSEQEAIFLPSPQEFGQLIVEAINKAGIKNRMLISSYSEVMLHIIKDLEPQIPLALLVETDFPPEENIDFLGFVPAVYSPDYKLVDEALVTFCKEQNMKLIPWTVNEKEDMKALIELGVDGLITDYPDRLKALLKELNK